MYPIRPIRHDSCGIIDTVSLLGVENVLANQHDGVSVVVESPEAGGQGDTSSSDSFSDSSEASGDDSGSDSSGNSRWSPEVRGQGDTSSSDSFSDSSEASGDDSGSDSSGNSRWSPEVRGQGDTSSSDSSSDSSEEPAGVGACEEDSSSSDSSDLPMGGALGDFGSRRSPEVRGQGDVSSSDSSSDSSEEPVGVGACEEDSSSSDSSDLPMGGTLGDFGICLYDVSTDKLQELSAYIGALLNVFDTANECACSCKEEVMELEAGEYKDRVGRLFESIYSLITESINVAHALKKVFNRSAMILSLDAFESYLNRLCGDYRDRRDLAGVLSFHRDCMSILEYYFVEIVGLLSPSR